MKGAEPFIGITCDIHQPKGRRDWHYELVCDHRYPEAVKQAGGYPILLPVAFRRDVVQRYLRRIDGLVIVGGDDIDPRLYGEQRKPGTGKVFRPRLNFERQLYQMARRQGMPILGVCYGMQLINVLEGGTLHQDIRRDAGSRLNHRGRKRPYHLVTLRWASRLRKLVGQRRIVVYSDHHQSVRKVAPGFRPVALAPDGTIEAIECETDRVFAVQWHPERSLNHHASKHLFRKFVHVCSFAKKNNNK